MEELSTYKVTDLRQALKDRGLPTTGAKNELVARLAAALSTEKNSGDDSVIDESLLDEDSMLAGEDDESEDVDSSYLENTGNGLESTSLVDDSTVGTTGEVTSSPKKLNGSESGASAAKKVKLNRDPVETVQANKVVVTSPKKPITAVTSDSTTETIKDPVKIDNVAILTPEERAKLRQQKFGAAAAAVALDDKKQVRAARFGIPVASSNGKPSSAAPVSAVDLERIEKRRQRFGIEASSKAAIELAKQKRAERFGGSAATSTASKIPVSMPETDEVKRKRAARFGS